jgi:membrane protease YdiL (CAAX protease family)
LAHGRFYRLAWGLYLGMALAGAVWVGLRERIIPLGLFLDTREWWLDLLLGLGAAALLLGVWTVAQRALPLARDLEAQISDLLGPLTRSEAIGLAVLSGFAEELFFRGAVQGAIDGIGGWLVASVVFGLVHTGPGRVFRLWTVFALTAGFLLGGLMFWRGNLLGPVVAHFVVNAVNLSRLAAQGDSGRLARGNAEGEKES